jgi:ABC-type multidrug transport system fused ATPase/permease subunit
MAKKRWLGLRLDLLAGVISVGASVVIASFRDELGLTPGLAGMMMVWSFNFSITIMFLVNSFTEAEAAATSCERLIALEVETPQEAPHWDLNEELMLLSQQPTTSSSSSSLVVVKGGDEGDANGRSFLSVVLNKCKSLCTTSCLTSSSPSSIMANKERYTKKHYEHAPPGWPHSGEVKFDNVLLRYRKGLDLALNGLSFTVPSGSRCGIVG